MVLSKKRKMKDRIIYITYEDGMIKMIGRVDEFKLFIETEDRTENRLQALSRIQHSMTLVEKFGPDFFENYIRPVEEGGKMDKEIRDKIARTRAKHFPGKNVTPDTFHQLVDDTFVTGKDKKYGGDSK